jgi:hypothetical protein
MSNRSVWPETDVNKNRIDGLGVNALWTRWRHLDVVT